ncbi:FecR family protein [Chitinophaga sp. Cy-1792]|uniref:FecR family protein n=1 Tax=Chitinophaga sp. Cy-1792 TaxID=2608339 RepID=UPI00141D8777|nr:FecR domain-containing protein [Chitinophaga sp. Cy-1792]NIG55019.1 FecR family protein [Chitinophaga sp. Cy-1792]
METSGNDIDWEKIQEALKNADTSGLTAAELDLLQTAREMKQRVQSPEKFPTEEGWQRFVAARAKKQLRVTWGKRLAVAAGIAVLLGVAGSWWTQRQHAQPPVMAKADLKPQQHIQIKLANGKVLTLDSTAITQNINGSTIKADSTGIVYNAGGQKSTAITYDTLVVPKGRKITIALADGTRAWVNAASILIFPAAFTGASREVQVQGEAYFEVAANAHQPFVVHSGNQTVTVLGTAFNVNAYTATMKTTLTNGKVSVTAGTQQILLSPGQQAVYQSQTGELTQHTVDTRIFTAWKDGDIYFEEADLSTIVNSLGRSFDYEFKFEDASLEKLTFTLDLAQPENLQQVLDQIRITNGEITFRIQGRTIYVARSVPAGQH